MSRRYGRKQRRGAREQIDELEKTLFAARQAVLSEGLWRDKAERDRDRLLEAMRYWDYEIRALLGPYTSFSMEDTTFRVDRPDQVRQMPVMPLAPSFLFSGPEAMPSIEYYAATMLSFIASFDEDCRERLSHLMTLRVKIGSDPTGERAHYALSERMWHELKAAGPDAQRRLAWRIAQDMVRLIAAPPKKEIPRTREEFNEQARNRG